MTQVQQLEAAIDKLSTPELTEFREWFENYVEDRLELSEETKQKIQEARQDIVEGRMRTRQPK